MQKSVFECLLDDDQLALLKTRIERTLEPEEDQVRFYPMSGHTRHKVLVMGMQPDRVIDDDVFIV